MHGIDGDGIDRCTKIRELRDVVIGELSSEPFDLLRRERIDVEHGRVLANVVVQQPEHGHVGVAARQCAAPCVPRALAFHIPHEMIPE